MNYEKIEGTTIAIGYAVTVSDSRKVAVQVARGEQEILAVFGNGQSMRIGGALILMGVRNAFANLMRFLFWG